MTAALLFYRGLTWLALVLGAPYLLFRWWRHPGEMRERWGGAAPTGSPVPSGERPVWIHAASLGEVEAARAWMAEDPLAGGRPWFVTVTSTSARRRAPERLGPGIPVRFAPLDHDLALGRFLARYRPSALVLLETELWPLTLDRCRRAGLPVYVVSGRITMSGWRKMRYVGRLYREVASAVRAAAVQGPEDETRFRELRVQNVRVCGNVKYRMPGDPARSDQTPNRSSASPVVDPVRTLWVIGSLRRGEEALLEAARRVVEAGGGVVVAPRHLREREAWVEACRRAGIEPVLRSALSAPGLGPTEPTVGSILGSGGAGTPRVLLVDVHGELRSWYQVASAATVGGTWVPIGGHNLFEPLCEGVPVSFGPYIANVRDVAEAAFSEGAAFQCADPADLVPWVLAQADPATRQKMERSALLAARRLAGAGERTRAFLSEAEAAEEGGGIIRPAAREYRAKTGPEDL